MCVCLPPDSLTVEPPGASVDNGPSVPCFGESLALTPCVPQSPEARTLEECMAILSDPQVRRQSRWNSSLGTKQKMSLVVYLSEGLPFVAFQRGASCLSDKEVMNLVTSRNILNYKLETVLETPERGVAIRREMLSPKLPVHSALACLPYKDYDYSKVLEHSKCQAHISLHSLPNVSVFMLQLHLLLCSCPLGDGNLL